MQTFFLIGYSHHEVICLRFWLLWKDKFAKHHIFNWKFKSHLKIAVETACQPVLEDHSSCRLECKRRFSLATLIRKSFTFVFDCSGEIFLPSIFSSTEVMSQTRLLKFLVCYFHSELFWSLNASSLVPLLCNFVNWESMGKQQKVASQNVSYVSCFLLLINRSHEPDTPTKFLACYFRRVRVGINW